MKKAILLASLLALVSCAPKNAENTAVRFKTITIDEEEYLMGSLGYAGYLAKPNLSEQDLEAIRKIVKEEVENVYRTTKTD